MRKEYICKNCGDAFYSSRECATRTPKYCCRKCSVVYSAKNPDTKRKQSLAKKGKEPWNKGLHMWEGKEHPKGTLGKHFKKSVPVSDKTRDKMRDATRKNWQKEEFRDKLSGKNASSWKGGITPINEAIRKGYKYKEWRASVFERDNYKCVLCGSSGYLHADHIKPFSLFEELRFELDNGRTLCEECHRETPTYGGKVLVYAKFIGKEDEWQTI